MAKYGWEHGIETHRLPLTEDLMRLLDIAQHDENIHDTITKQATTLAFDVGTILDISMEPTEASDHLLPWEHDLVVTIARGGELLGDFYARHFMHEKIEVFSDRVDSVEISCVECDVSLYLSKESLIKLKD